MCDCAAYSICDIVYIDHHQSSYDRAAHYILELARSNQIYSLHLCGDSIKEDSDVIEDLCVGWVVGDCSLQLYIGITMLRCYVWHCNIVNHLPVCLY